MAFKNLQFSFFLFISISINAQNYSFQEVQTVLNISGRNKSELEKTISYFKSKGDSLQLKALYFLIANMDIHSSSSYYWADSLGRRIFYKELGYKNFESSIDAFDSLRNHHGKIHPVEIIYKDVDSIKSDYLIANIEQSFLSWENSKTSNLSFNDFCEYVLPYRVSVEPLQNWRYTYQKQFRWVSDSVKNDSIFKTCNTIKLDIKNWFTNTYGVEERNEPLPRLGALQLLHRKKGNCEDIAGLTVFALRSLGIPATEDISVYWGTSTGSHFWNVVFKDSMKSIPFDVSNPSMGQYTLAREPSKVIRLTYSKQSNTIASRLPTSQIPEGFLRNKNYIDVTHEYWQVYDLPCNLHSGLKHEKIVYACVFNNKKWQPIWWGKVAGNKTKFDRMPGGVVFLPINYRNNKPSPAGYPVALFKDGVTQELKPDMLKSKSITLREQDKYLIYRPGKKYTLYYWRNKWIKHDEKIATTKELVFEKVPSHALLLLVPEYSKRKERPFTIDEKGERFWW